MSFSFCCFFLLPPSPCFSLHLTPTLTHTRNPLSPAQHSLACIRLTSVVFLLNTVAPYSDHPTHLAFGQQQSSALTWCNTRRSGRSNRVISSLTDLHSPQHDHCTDQITHMDPDLLYYIAIAIINDRHGIPFASPAGQISHLILHHPRFRRLFDCHITSLVQRTSSKLWSLHHRLPEISFLRRQQIQENQFWPKEPYKRGSTVSSYVVSLPCCLE